MKISLSYIYPDIAYIFYYRTGADRSERFQGEPSVKETLTSQTPAGVRIEWSPPLPLKCQIDRRLKP
jgi:hypothetical protein